MSLNTKKNVTVYFVFIVYFFAGFTVSVNQCRMDCRQNAIGASSAGNCSIPLISRSGEDVIGDRNKDSMACNCDNNKEISCGRETTFVPLLYTASERFSIDDNYKVSDFDQSIFFTAGEKFNTYLISPFNNNILPRSQFCVLLI